MRKNNYNFVHFMVGIFMIFAFFEFSPQRHEFVAGMVFIPEKFWAGEVWRIVTYAFIQNSSVFWLIFKLLVFLYLAAPLESLWGTRFFVSFLCVSIFVGAITSLIFNIPLRGGFHLDLSIMLLHGFLFPQSIIYLFFIFPIRVKHLAIFSTILFLLGCASLGYLGICYFLGMLSGVVYCVALSHIPTMKRTIKAIANGEPKNTWSKKTAEKKAVELYNKGMGIAEKVKNKTASYEEEEWLETLDQNVVADREICSPYTFGPQTNICPSCSAYKICLKRHAKNDIKENS